MQWGGGGVVIFGSAQIRVMEVYSPTFLPLRGGGWVSHLQEKSITNLNGPSLGCQKFVGQEREVTLPN